VDLPVRDTGRKAGDPPAGGRLSAALDTLNRPTGRTGTFVVHQVTGTEQQSIRRFRAWTSTDSGTTWRRAPAHQRGDGAYRVKLPSVTPGAGVSLRVDVRDTAGNRIEQTLYDAYAR
jgi:hypothetical protein